MNDDKGLPDDREVKGIVQLLRTEAVRRLKPHGSVGGWEAVESAAEILERQSAWIAELEQLVLGFDRAGAHPRPTAGEPALDRRNESMWAACQFAWSQEDLRKTLEKVRARHSHSKH